MNHPFIDGNKRTGYLLMEAMLRYDGVKISSTDDEVYNFVIDISTGSMSLIEMVEWLKNNTTYL